MIICTAELEWMYEGSTLGLASHKVYRVFITHARCDQCVQLRTYSLPDGGGEISMYSSSYWKYVARNFEKEPTARQVLNVWRKAHKLLNNHRCENAER